MWPPRGATQSGKGYQLGSDLSGAVAVASRDRYKNGGCPVIISSQREAVIILIVNIVDQRKIIFVLTFKSTSVGWLIIVDLKGLSLGFYERRGLYI